MKLKLTYAALIIAVLTSTGLGVWGYIHTHVIIKVQKTFDNGSTYEGDWLAGMMHGKGILTFADGSTYEGEFIQGRRTGLGKLVSADDSYEGEWLDDLFHGDGIYTSPKGNLYEGTWKHGQLPEGVLYYTADKKRYEGEFRGLIPDGFGIMQYEDGSVYLGHWSNGAKQGLGRRVNSDGKVDFGYWNDGMIIDTGGKFKTGDVVYGIDISKYQKDWNWEDLALFADAKGQVYQGKPKQYNHVQPSFFVIIKSTEGSDVVDPHYASNVEKAKKSRIIKGAYHFMSTQSEIETQITNFTENAIVEKGDFPPVLDIEVQDSRIAVVGINKVRQMALKWLEAIEDHYGVRPVIYTNENFRRKYLSGPEFSKYDFWVARYSDKEPSGEWLMWQYTQTGNARGIRTTVDINQFSGNLKEFNKYINDAWN